MFKRQTTLKALAASAVLVSMLLAGCGGNPAADEEFLEEPGYEEPGYTDPGTPGYTDPNAGGIPGVGNGGMPGGVGGVQPGQEMTASCEVLKKGFLLGKTKVAVTVSNPATVPQTGTLTVTFTKKGSPTKHVKTESISLSAGESVTKEFIGAMIGTDGANAEVVTDQAMTSSGGAGYGQTAGYGQQNGYGQTSGTGYNY